MVSRSVLALKEFLSEKGMTRFRPYDVEFLLHPLLQSALEDQVLGLTLTFSELLTYIECTKYTTIVPSMKVLVQCHFSWLGYISLVVGTAGEIVL